MGMTVGKNFHESYHAGEVKPPSERSTGITFAVIAAIIALIFRDNFYVLSAGLNTAVILALISWQQPIWLKPLNLAWFRFGLLLHKVMNPVIMFVLFAIVIVPAGLIMSVFRDPLKKRRNAQAKTYWEERNANDDAKSSMANQF